MKRIIALVCGLLLSCFGFAHDLDLTVITVMREKGATTLKLATPLSRLVSTAALGDHPSGPELDLAVRERLAMAVGTTSAMNVNSEADILTWWAPLVGHGEIPIRRFDPTPASRTIVVTVENGVVKSEILLVAGATQPSAPGMVQTGIMHILSGLDHILFVVGLALLGGGWKTLLKILTAFTVAHSVTLTCAVLGCIHGNPRIVEPLIALSIVALAVEGLRPKKDLAASYLWVRMGIAFGFGLIHGFGFAGGLAELGFQGSQLLGNLTSFSAGIELGQIAILAPTFVILALVAKAGRARALQFAMATFVCLGMIGSFWLMERMLCPA